MNAKRTNSTLLKMILFLALGYSTTASAHGYFHHTHHYVVHTQEYRHSTRFTLTEWLLIKERMKMMDLWLAMFSDPKKESGKFRPEFNIIYGTHSGGYEVSGDDNFEASLKGKYFKGQIWLTNVISGTTGIKTLNIDLGGEGYMRLSDEAFGVLSGDSAAQPASITGNIAARYYSANLRLFGKNIQDSSIVAKFGTYEIDNTLFLSQIPQYVPETKDGSFAGGEVQFYLTKNLGVEGNIQQYQEANTVVGSNTIAGQYYEYNAYLEVSLFRLMVGKYSETWEATDSNGSYTVKGEGFTTGLKLQF